jgi:predicted Zn-dependent protease
LLHRALTLDPDYSPARIHRAEVYRQLYGFGPEAIRELREVLARDPTNARARVLLEEYLRNPPPR